MDFWDFIHLTGAVGAVLMIATAVVHVWAILKGARRPAPGDAAMDADASEPMDDVRFGKHGPTYREFGDDVRKMGKW